MTESDETNHAAVTVFIERWERSGAAERANYQLFLTELCDILGVPRPNPVTASELARTFTRVRADKVEELLKAMVTLDQARKVGEGRCGGWGGGAR